MTDDVTCWFAAQIQDKFEEDHSELIVVLQQDGYGGMESLCHEIISDFDGFNDEKLSGPSSFFDAVINSIKWAYLRYLLQRWVDDKVDDAVSTSE
jgi:hypothetical protein